VKDVLRSRRRVITAILGVVLAITFIAGTFIAIDSSTRATLDGLLSGVWTDMSFLASSGNGSDVREAVEGVPGVIRAAVSRSLSIHEIVAGDPLNGTAEFGQVVMGVEPDHLPFGLQSITISEGSFEMPRGTVALEQTLAGILEVSRGDTVAFRNSVFRDSEGNMTTVWVNVTVGALFRGVPSGGDPFTERYSPGALVHIRDVEWYDEQLGMQDGDSISGGILVDHDRLINPYDLETSKRNLARLERQINLVLASFDGRVTSNRFHILDAFESVIAFQRVTYLALSIPVILLGLYLGAVGVDLGHAERRRELAVLKTRGAGRRQLLGLLMLEAALGGLVAAVIGLVAGIGMSRLLLAFVTPFGSAASARYDVLLLSTTTVVTVVILAVLFMAVTSFRSARRTANLPIVETLRYYAPGETKIHYRPTIDIILVTLAAITYGMVFYMQTERGDFLTFLVGAIFVVLLPFAPISLIIGSTRLLTRSSGRVYEWSSRVARPFAKNLYYLISKNLQRNPRRSANVAVIIALGIAFGLFILVTVSSQLVYQERQVRASLGADIAIDEPSSDPMFAANLSQLVGVAGVSPVHMLRAPVLPGDANVYGLDPATYFAVTNPEPFYFRDGGIPGAKQVLETPGQVLVTESYLEDAFEDLGAFLEVGDPLQFEYTVYDDTGNYTPVTVDTTIGGIVRGLPGFPNFFGYGKPIAVYGSVETVAPPIGSSGFGSFTDIRYLVDLTPGADWRSVRDGIVGLGGSRIQVVEEHLERLRSDPVFRAFFGFMQLEIAFMVVILTAGLGLILYAATLERDVELAAVRARGATGWQTAGLLIGEAASIMLIGLIVGGGIGTLTAYLATSVTVAAVGESLVPLTFTIPPQALLLLALAPVAILATAFSVSVRVARMDVARVLKLRGG
jgi:putative ABC transport system permease protein